MTNDIIFTQTLLQVGEALLLRKSNSGSSSLVDPSIALQVNTKVGTQSNLNISISAEYPSANIFLSAFYND